MPALRQRARRPRGARARPYSAALLDECAACCKNLALWTNASAHFRDAILALWPAHAARWDFDTCACRDDGQRNSVRHTSSLRDCPREEAAHEVREGPNPVWFRSLAKPERVCTECARPARLHPQADCATGFSLAESATNTKPLSKVRMVLVLIWCCWCC